MCLATLLALPPGPEPTREILGNVPTLSRWIFAVLALASLDMRLLTVRNGATFDNGAKRAVRAESQARLAKCPREPPGNM